MITGGNATVFVTNMDRAVDFYTNVLGMKLRMRAADHWAEVEAGPDLVIGLHPDTTSPMKAGTSGSIQIGLTVSDPIDDVVATLVKRGVAFGGPVVDDGPVRLAFFKDLDGNVLYLVELAGATT